jgi:hypothetical protein
VANWEGVAGGRVAWVDVTNDGQDTCLLSGPPAAALVDGGGTVLVASTGPVGGGVDLELAAGETGQLFVSVHNWCADPPGPPVSIGLTLPSGGPILALPDEGVTFDPPFCAAPGQPATISVAPESWTTRPVCCNRIRRG